MALPTHDAAERTNGSTISGESTVGLENARQQANGQDDIEVLDQLPPESVERVYTKQVEDAEGSWAHDPENPYNWSRRKKNYQVLSVAVQALVASIGTSIISSSRSQLMEHFNVGSTVAIMPLSLYVLALACGPVLGGPASETLGRMPVYLVAIPLGALFTVGAGLSQNFASLCILRFLAGFSFSPALAIGPATVADIFTKEQRGIPSIIFVTTPMLGPGLGPVIGSFVAVRKGWRWTQWTLAFMASFSLLITLFARETHHHILIRRRAKNNKFLLPPPIPFRARIRLFLTVSLLRPMYMLFTEPIVGFVSLYASCSFATLFAFFAAFPYVFTITHQFSTEEIGLTFLAIVIGCLFAVPTVALCDVFLYRRQIPNYPPNKVPPEHRLYPAMIGGIGLPLGLFWFAWTAKKEISWVSPTLAAIPFAWGNLSVFIGTASYMLDSYTPMTAASAMSANGFARYALGAAFPLFTLQMYQKLGIGWATSLLGFISVALLPTPWVLFQFGKKIRAMSHYETADS
ncbi:related to TPO4-Proposed vacuolar polyamine transporter [Phialocephala subalpina]|uniref:Related to TPO4-Proposed vacuolar polyamine transporter n=1 Tax=Phialocephala subalpina TaxID=576137 RepID=A0A1L7XJJ7_9HELO|nr:related to TPO4-Proposed vacuolar polyamine transporter [Phialocephala subalpina]